MASLIPQDFIDDLLDRVDIVDVVDGRVKLKRSGKNYSACCPFHEEKTPSFTVSPDKQFFYCFGCGASGNAVGFVMDYERLTFPEAVEALARSAGLDVPKQVQSEAQIEREQEKKNLYSLMQKANDFYQQQLRHHPSKQMAVNYLKGRGLDGKTAKAFGVGFAPPGWDNLLKSLGQDDQDKRLLIEGGMLIHQEQDKKLYDRFRHRIMFPIIDLRGRVIGFGGRVLGDDKPKYLNSPETSIFHKGQELYGLYQAREANRELKRLLVVEGYMDVVSLAQFGISYAVATLGTACGEDHLTKAFKHTTEVVFCFDGDQAGRTAARRALDASLTSMTDGRTVKFLFLPDGEDPDTLVRQIGADKFERMVDLAVPLEDFLFDAAAEGLNIRSLEGRARFSRRAAPLLDKLPRGVFRELMFDQLAVRTGLSRHTLEELIHQSESLADEVIPKEAPKAREETTTKSFRSIVNTSTDSTADAFVLDAPPTDYEEVYFAQAKPSFYREPKPTQAKPKYLMPPARKALALLLTHPDLAGQEPNSQTWFSAEDTDIRLLGQLLKLLHERPHYQLSHIIGYWRAAYGAEGAEQLASIAGHDLLLAANAISRVREDKPAKADYDSQVAFVDCLKKLRLMEQDALHKSTLKTVNQSDFSALSAEDKAKIRAALEHKKPTRL
ncbi:MAG: DNA primase [Cellvibrio sp.]|nr:DNA primase [Cellvibrio sp.]